MDPEIVRNLIRAQAKIGNVGQEWTKVYEGLSASSNTQTTSNPNVIYTNPSMYRGVNRGFAQYGGN
jgi:hypothetical protein